MQNYRVPRYRFDELISDREQRNLEILRYEE